MPDPIHRGFPGHFIGWRSCCFRLCTDVGTYRVSSVGCYHPEGLRTTEPQEIGSQRTFETFVFEIADPRSVNAFGVPDLTSSGEIDSEGYRSWEAAEVGHEAMVEKWQAIAEGRGDRTAQTGHSAGGTS